MKNDERYLIETFTKLIRLPSPGLKELLAHKAEELKCMFSNDLQQYESVENIIDPEVKEGGEPGTLEGTRKTGFELQEINRVGWVITPDEIPREVADYILANNKPGPVISMHRVKLEDGRMITLSFEKVTGRLFTGFIIEKIPGSTGSKPKNTSKLLGITATDSKKKFLKQILPYLLENDHYYQALVNDFYETWQPLIDKGVIVNGH